jgi:hypothetical protein
MVLNVRSRAERTIEQKRGFIDDFGEPYEVGEAAADNKHSQRGDQID